MGEPLTDLIQAYRIEQEALIAHQREVERRRAAVRAAVAGETADIIARARHEIRGVLQRARQELVTLRAQVRAAGCEAASGESGEPDDFHASAARDVRTVLREARSELAGLSQAGFAQAVPNLSVSSAPPHEESDRVRDDSTDPLPAAGVVEQLSAYWRIAVIALAVLAVVATLVVSLGPSSKTEDAASAAPSSSQRSTPQTSSKGSSTAQAELNPTATRGSDVRPPKPTSASGVTAETKPALPPAATVAKRAAAQTQTPAPPAPAPAATVSDDTATAERDILERHQRWFDAFDRGDRATMASLAADNFSIVDERPGRPPAGSGPVERTIRDVRVRVTGIGAVLSGQIAETPAAGDAVPVAMLSEVWIRREETWQLVSVRMVPLDAVPRTLQ